jgi:hypothetical protein
MSAHTIHAFLREKGLMSAVAILLAAVIQSPVAVGIVVSVSYLPTVPLKRLLRPSKWPRLRVWPFWTWGAIYLVAVSLIVAWFSHAPDILTCVPVPVHEDVFFCWKSSWKLPRLVVPVGLHLLLLWYDYRQYRDFCDAGTEVLITRIDECNRNDDSEPSSSWMVHSNAELDDEQLRKVTIGFPCLTAVPSLPFLYEGVWYQLCLWTVHFMAESDGTRVRRVSTCTPEMGRPIEFTPTRSSWVETTELCFATCPLAMGLTSFALHGFFLFAGAYNHFGWFLFLVFVVLLALPWGSWLIAGRKVEPFLDKSVDSLCEFLCVTFVSCLFVAYFFLLYLGVVVPLASPTLALDTTVRAFGALALSCVLLRILAEVPDVGPPIKCAASILARLIRSFCCFVVPTFAKSIKAGLATLALAGVLLSAPSAVAVASVVTVAVPARVRMLVVVGAVKAISGLLVSPRRQPAILKTGEARSKHRRPKLVPLAHTSSKVGSDSARVASSCRGVPSEATGASGAQRRVFGRRRVHEGRRPPKKAVAANSRKGGAVLGALASSVAPVRRSLRLARRVVGGGASRG